MIGRHNVRRQRLIWLSRNYLREAQARLVSQYASQLIDFLMVCGRADVRPPAIIKEMQKRLDHRSDISWVEYPTGTIFIKI